jgi:hypothetical protein
MAEITTAWVERTLRGHGFSLLLSAWCQRGAAGQAIMAEELVQLVRLGQKEASVWQCGTCGERFQAFEDLNAHLGLKGHLRL